MHTNIQNPNTLFGEEVKMGLTAFPKTLPSKYFYNAEGSRIFQQIMDLEEYYLTKCEYEILQAQKAQILACLPLAFDLVELGAGDGLKTKILLHYFLENHLHFDYIPIDISSDILYELKNSLLAEMPNLSVKPLHDDYFGALQKISSFAEKPKVVLFLGSNIGNFTIHEATHFLTKLRHSLNKGDFLLLGVDLVKSPEIILKAYSDSKGITANFNYNLLQRINEELGGTFDVAKFLHYATYHPQTGETKSYLISKEAQNIWIEHLHLSIHFEAWESIYTEVSQKFTLPQMAQMATHAGFEIKQHFFDSHQYFTNTLWEAL